jgi:hypothetical protein
MKEKRRSKRQGKKGWVGYLERGLVNS